MPGLPEIIFVIFFLLVAIGGAALWIWMIVDCASNESSQGYKKAAWIVVIVLAQLPGALIYLLFRRPSRIREHGR